MNLAVIITAAGSSQRFGTEKKEYISLDNEPLLLKTCRCFYELDSVCQWIVTVPQGDEQKVCEILQDEPMYQDLRVISGGETRQASVHKALLALQASSIDAVMIHDGARPFASKKLLQVCLDTLKQYGSALPLVSSVSALKTIDEEGFVLQHVERSAIYQAQTPQCFGYSDIFSAHTKALEDKTVYVDDSEIYQKYIGKVKTCQGDVHNIKITYRSDIKNQ